jgi:hypothetical protein
MNDQSGALTPKMHRWGGNSIVARAWLRTFAPAAIDMRRGDRAPSPSPAMRGAPSPPPPAERGAPSPGPLRLVKAPAAAHPLPRGERAGSPKRRRPPGGTKGSRKGEAVRELQLRVPCLPRGPHYPLSLSTGWQETMRTSQAAGPAIKTVTIDG